MTVKTPTTRLSPARIQSVKSGIAQCDRVLAKARTYKVHPDTKLIAKYEAHRQRLTAMLPPAVA